MIRSELCAIAGMNRETFNTHRRNGDLPFDVPQGDDEKGSWGRFTLHDATLMLAARRLVDMHGVQWSRAAAMLRQRPLWFKVPGSGSNYFDGPGWFRVQVDFCREDGTPPESHICPAVQYCHGSLEEIAQWANRIAKLATKRHSESRYIVGGEVVVVGFLAVDMSVAWRLATLRAERLEIDLSGDTLEPGDTTPTDAEGEAE